MIIAELRPENDLSRLLRTRVSTSEQYSEKVEVVDGLTTPSRCWVRDLRRDSFADDSPLSIKAQ
jgi:hypothetical protein